MNAELFKTDLRTIVNNNPQAIKFTIRYAGKQAEFETYETKKDFGNRVLELMKDKNTGTVEITTLKRKGFFGRHNVAKQDFLLFTDIEAIEFTVWTVSELENTNGEFYYK